jgi:MerR family redox-sensitive transcriptional activator SoxR
VEDLGLAVGAGRPVGERAAVALELRELAQLLRRLGVAVLPVPVRVGGQRRYGDDALRTLAVVETAQRAGLTLDEIKTLLAAPSGEASAVTELRSIAERKLPQVEAAIERSLLVKDWLEAAARCDCPSLDDCPLFV